MKKIFTFFAAALFAATVNAENYTGPLKVYMNGQSTDSGNATVEMTDNGNGTCSLTLKNFTFVADGQAMPVGTINLKDIDCEKSSAVAVFDGENDLTIADGDDPNVSFWMGQMLGEMPVFIRGTVYNGKMNAVILIDANKNDLGIIKVHFGENADEVGQIANSGFEKYHKAGSIDEPNAWHSFGSCDGTLAGAVKGTPHTEAVNDPCPGSKGTQSLRIYSSVVFGVSANGTVTTGRMTAGAMSAKDTKNHAYLDFSKTDLDGNGDPFYTTLAGAPDSLGVWVKYKPGKSGIKASLSAVITDGTYYQDPEDKTYKNVAAKASNTDIETNDGEWQYVTVPFDYASNIDKDGEMMVEPKAILVTISTCATPGGGSTNGKNVDNLYIDDLRLVYNYKPISLSYDGQSFADFAADKYEYTLAVDGDFNPDRLESEVLSVGSDDSVVSKLDENGNGTVYYTVISGDLQNTVTYKINVTNTTGINSAKTNSDKGVAGVYDLSGCRVNTKSNLHGVYIVRTADGKTYKVNK